MYVFLSPVMPDLSMLTVGYDRFGLAQHFRRFRPRDQSLVGEQGNH